MYSRKLPSEIHLRHLVKVMQSYLLSEHVTGLQGLTNIARASTATVNAATGPLGTCSSVCLLCPTAQAHVLYRHLKVLALRPK